MNERRDTNAASFEPERYELYEAPRYQFELDRRDFFKVLGCGVLVLWMRDPAPAQESGRGGRRAEGGRSPEIDAWLHLGEDGTVTAMTGKTEVGQNIRTSLTQAVAEELQVPIGSIRMVMADTDVVPYDRGTFGSRTTPDIHSQLRRVAAAAQQALIDMAAERLQADRQSLKAIDGKIVHEESGKAISYGELTRGQKLLKAISDETRVKSPDEWQVVGQSTPKINGASFVTGRHQYTSDLKRPGMLYGKVLRPAAFEATLASVDTRAAEAIGEVVVVRDGDFVGIAAPDELTATRAVEAIRAEWNTRTQPSSADLYEHLKKTRADGDRFRRSGRTVGSMQQGLAAADHQLEATYTIAYIAHAPLEPRAAVAEWSDGKLTVWTGTQRPFGVRSELAQAFGLSEDQVRVIVPDTGSGYGGKHTGEAAVEAARLAKAAGRPVKLVWTREEEFTWAYFRPAGVIEVKAGVRNDGTLTAWEFHNYNSGGSAIETLYEVPHQQIAFHAAQSPLRQGSYRALAATANHFARESHMDDLAQLVQMDPLEFRLKNLQDARLRGVLQAAADAFGWDKRQSAADRGFGIAVGSEKGSYIATCVEISLDEDRERVQIERITAAFECGAVVNPDGLKNQIEGSIVMGIGGALFEEIRFENGRVLNPRFALYRVPRFRDVPPIEIVLVDRKDLPSVGAGETPIVTIAPAIGNAIFNATGIRLRSLPMLPSGRIG